MKKYFAIAALAVASAFTAPAQAMPVGSGLGQAADNLAAIEKTQFIYLGRNYCWYDDGWRGPGFYWCGYAFRRGLGWGGGVGWRGWHHGGPGPRVMGPRGVGPRGGGPGPRAFRAGPPRGGAMRGGGGPRQGGFKKH